MLSDERGLTTLEKLGVLSIIITILAFIPPVRGALGDLYDSIFKQIDPDTGEVTAFSIATRGLLITIVSVAAFLGSGYLVLYTNMGKRMAFLITGAATTGWLAIGSMLFVIYAPRGLRPRLVEGLNSVETRIPATALMIASFVLFLVFLAAMNRLEESEADA